MPTSTTSQEGATTGHAAASTPRSVTMDINSQAELVARMSADSAPIDTNPEDVEDLPTRVSNEAKPHNPLPWHDAGKRPEPNPLADAVAEGSNAPTAFVARKNNKNTPVECSVRRMA